MSKRLTHFDKSGNASMVDISGKPVTHRFARASGSIRMLPETLDIINKGAAKKGDVLGIARIAAIQAAKRTSELIPLCHLLPLSKISVNYDVHSADARIDIFVIAETVGQTGVEMEALTAASIGLLTIYDMCKSIDRGMIIDDVRLIEKSGGKSGTFLRTDS